MDRHWTDNLRTPIALLLFFGTAAVGITADLWSKSLAAEHLDGAMPWRFMPGLLHFTFTKNHGAVFGLGQGQRALFLFVSVGAIGFLMFLFLTSERSRIYQFVLGMLLAGVIGNMYDRLKLGYVRDMIHALPEWYWPQWIVNLLPGKWQPQFGQRLELFPWIFNIADTLLCVGVGAMLLYSFVSEIQRKRSARTNDKADDAGDSGKRVGLNAPVNRP